MSDEVLIERHDTGVWVLKLNRPKARNAVNGAMAQAIDAAIAESNEDESVRAVILASSSAGDPAGDVFCAGADLKELAAGRAAELSTPKGGFAGFTRAERKKPWIAAVSGKALGGGLELCLACDLVVAGEGASFGLPEVLRGIFAGAGGVFRLPRVIPRAIALEMIATGVPIDASRAYALGLVNRLVPQGRELAAAVELADAIAKAAPVAVHESLSLARSSSEHTESQLWRLSDELGARLAKTEDFWEGPRAFAEKRPPQWKGR